MKTCLTLFLVCALTTTYCQPLVEIPKSADDLFGLALTAQNNRDYAAELAYLYAYWQKKGKIRDDVKETILRLRSSLSITQPRAGNSSSKSDGIGVRSEMLTLPPSTLKMEEKPQTYPLVIRGMANADFDLLTVNGVPFLRLYFTKAAIGVGMSQERKGELMPSQAAWLDRPIAQDEPNHLLIQLPDDFSLFTKNGVASANYSFFNELRNSNSIVTFDAYNDSEGSFKITNTFQPILMKRRR